MLHGVTADMWATYCLCDEILRTTYETKRFSNLIKGTYYSVNAFLLILEGYIIQCFKSVFITLKFLCSLIKIYV